jgi:plasmid stabilization system protein ParE
MLPYDLTERAVLDLEHARAWYDRGSVDLGNRFIDAVLAVIATAREHPDRFPVVRKGVRGARCRRFPYRVYYEPFADRIIVLAVYHTARDPRRWDDLERE